MFEKRLNEVLQLLPAACPRPSPAGVQRMGRHAELLGKWNKTHNLTSLSAEDEIVEALFVDAWLVAAVWPADAKGLVDVGAGGGFPGLVLLAEWPFLDADLFEKVAKKRSFLEVAAAGLGLGGVQVHGSFPPASPAWPATPTAFVSRATWAPADWLALALAQARPGDYVIVQSGRESLPAVAPGTERVAQFETTLPLSGAQRRLACDRKIA